MHDRLARGHDLSGISKSIDDGSIRVCKKNGISGCVFRDLGVSFSRGKLGSGGVEGRFRLFITLWGGSQSILHQRRIAFLISLCLDQDGARCDDRIALRCQRELEIGFINAHQGLALSHLLTHIDHPLDNLAWDPKPEVALNARSDGTGKRPFRRSCLFRLGHPYER